MKLLTILFIIALITIGFMCLIPPPPEYETERIVPARESVLTSTPTNIEFITAEEIPGDKFELGFKPATREYFIGARNKQDSGFDEVVKIDQDGDIFLRGKWIGHDERLNKFMKTLNKSLRWDP